MDCRGPSPVRLVPTEVVRPSPSRGCQWLVISVWGRLAIERGLPRLPPKLCSMHQMKGTPWKESVRFHRGKTSANRSSMMRRSLGTPSSSACLTTAIHQSERRRCQGCNLTKADRCEHRECEPQRRLTQTPYLGRAKQHTGHHLTLLPRMRKNGECLMAGSVATCLDSGPQGSSMQESWRSIC